MAWNDIRLWDIKSQRLLAILRGATRRVNSVAFSVDGTRLASGSSDGTVQLWNIELKEADQAVPGWWARESMAILQGHTDEVWAVTFSLDGTTIASGSFDKTIKLWDAQTEKNIMGLSNYK